MTNKSAIGLFLTGTRRENVDQIQEYLKRDQAELLRELPDGTLIRVGHAWPILIETTDIESDDERRDWIIKRLNQFASVLRPRLKAWYAETERQN